MVENPVNKLVDEIRDQIRDGVSRNLIESQNRAAQLNALIAPVAVFDSIMEGDDHFLCGECRNEMTHWIYSDGDICISCPKCHVSILISKHGGKDG